MLAEGLYRHNRLRRRITYSARHIAVGSAVKIVTRPLKLVVIANRAVRPLLEEKFGLSLNGDLRKGSSLYRTAWVSRTEQESRFHLLK